MVRMVVENPRVQEYDNYINTHVRNVVRVWDEILCPFLVDNIELFEYDFKVSIHNLEFIRNTITCHDVSKWSPEEYYPYLNYFYPEHEEDKDEDEFNKAWLHHQHSNQHHWQYWTLVLDEGEVVPLDMPFDAICEMLCDWSSFQYTDNPNTANGWYELNKDNMILSDRTRRCVELILDKCECL